VELSDFYRDLDQGTLVRVQIFDEQKPADGPCVSVGRGDLGKSTALRLVLNNKAVKRFDGGSYASITRLVAEQPSEEFLESWPLWQRRPLQPQEALKEMTLEVDDASPDSTLGVILLLARLAECNLARFPKEWVEAAESWEKTGMVADPRTSWVTLCSALAHKHFPVTGNPTDKNYVDAWLDTLRFTSGCLARNAHPLKLESMSDWELWREATALLEQEEQAYHDWLTHAETLQLSLPLRKGAGRRLLIDALLVAEDQATGAAKVFFRTDSSNTTLKRGFTLAAHYRPNERKGDGNDFTIALDYRWGLALLDLWKELERLECAAWEAAGETRPADNPRVLEGVENNYNEPWYIDRERTLVAAPHKLSDGRLGSKLEWKDVCAAIWRVYNPLHGVEVLEHHAGSGATASRVSLLNLQHAKTEAGKRLLLASWPFDRNDPVLHGAPRALTLSPTVERILATLIEGPATTPSDMEGVALSSLVPPGSWRRVALSGGFAIVAEKGVFILDDWHREVPLAFDQLEREFESVSRLDENLRTLEGHIECIADRLMSGERRAWWHWHQQGLVRDVAAIMFQLAALRGSATGISSHADARLIREAMDKQWAVDRRLAAMEQQVQTINSSLKALSDATMWRAAYVLTVGGFTLVSANVLAPQLGALLGFWLTKGQFVPQSAQPNPYWWVAFFLIVALVFFVVLSLTRNVTPNPLEGEVPTAPER
jgi:hypothetical protein